MIVTGIFFGGIFGFFLCHRRQKNFLDFILISTLVIAFGFVTAKILYILITYPVKNFFYVIFKMLLGRDESIMSGGFVFYGGIPGALIGYYLGVKLAKCSHQGFYDIFAVVLPIVQGFGRIGCHFAGCCYGSFFPGTMIRFPVQALEASILFSLGFIFLFCYNHNKTNLLYGYSISYAVIRFLLEYLRGDTIRGYFWMFSTSQWISIFVVIAVIILLIYNKITKMRDIEQ